MMQRQRSGARAVLSLLLAGVLAVVLAAPFGSATAPAGATGRPGPAAPGFAAGLLGHPDALGLPPKIHLQAARAPAPHAPMPWADPAPSARSAAHLQPVAAAPTHHNSSAGHRAERSRWGRAPPHARV
jgi:hypothetical protein